MSLLRLRAMKTCLPGPSLNPFLPLWLVTELMGCFKTPAFAFFSHEKNKWSGGIDAMTNQEHVFVKPSKCRLSKKKKQYRFRFSCAPIKYRLCRVFIFYFFFHLTGVFVGHLFCQNRHQIIRTNSAVSCASIVIHRRTLYWYVSLASLQGRK